MPINGSQTWKRYKLKNGDQIEVHWGSYATGSSQVYDVYHDRKLTQLRCWVEVDELTMRCIVEALKQDPRAGMEESDG
jgi:hypothetical protein